MKILLWSDVHCHLHRPFARYADGMNSRLRDGLRIIDQVTEAAGDCDMTMFLGDLFHVSPPPAPAFNEVFDRIRKLGRLCPTLMLAGNHDLRNKYYSGDARDIPFLKFRRFDGINIAEVDASMSVEMDDGTKVLAFNHRRESDAAEIIKKAEPHDILVMHQEVFGADNEFGYTFKGGMHPDDLKKFKWVFTGHIHKPQILNERVVVVGAPLHIDFGDVGDRGFFILDTEKDDVEVHETTFPRFVTLGAGDEAPDDDNFYRPEQAKEKKRDALKIPDWGEAVEAYCHQQKHPEYIKVGREIADATPKELIAPQPFSIMSVELQNFGVFEKAEYDIESGLHMVIGDVAGVDGRSNGAGKTTLFEGISWVIYGRTSKGVRGSSVMKRNRKRGKACLGVVTLVTPEGGELKIIRTQKANGSTLEAWFGDTHEEGRVPQVQEWITDTLGVDYEFFQQMVYFSQEQAEFFSEMGDADRKRILGTLLGTRWYEAAEKEAKSQRDAARDLRDTAVSDLKYGEATLVNFVSEVETASAAVGRWQSTHDADVVNAGREIIEVGTALEKAKADVDEERATIAANKKEEMDDAASGHAKAVTNFGEREKTYLDNMRDGFDIDIKEAGESLEKLRKKRAVFGEAVALEAEVTAAEAELEVQREVAKSIVQRSAAAGANKNTVEGHICKIRIRIDDIVDLKTGVRCQTCGAEITEDSKEACLDEMRKEIVEAEAELEEHNAALANADEDADKSHAVLHVAEDRVKAANMGIQGAERLDTKIATLVTEVENLKKQRVSAAAEAKAELKAERVEVDRDNEVLVARIEKRYADKLAVLQRTKQVDVTRLEERARQALTESERVLADTNPHVEARDRASESVQKQESDNAKLTGEVRVEENRIETFDFWVSGFGREGIRAALLVDFCKVFTSEVNDTLTQMGVGMAAELSPSKNLKKKGEVRDQLSYHITTPTGEMEYQELSGGEKVRIDLASMLALNLIASRHFGIEDGLFGILVLDEIFSSLDEAGVEVVYQIINGFTARSIYVISHDPSMKSLFDKVITVLRDGTESVLVA